MTTLSAPRRSSIEGALSLLPYAVMLPSASLVVRHVVRILQQWAERRCDQREPLTTSDWLLTSRICALLPRWRLHLSVMKRWFQGGLDPTTGKQRSYWSLKADAYEQMAPKFTLAHIAKWFPVQKWKIQLAEALDDASAPLKSGGKDGLREAIEKLCPGSGTLSNSVRIPVDGHQAFQWRRRLIQSAKRRILLMNAYISVDSDARAIIEDLADAAKRGVEVYVALDNFGADAFVWCGVDTRYKDGDKDQFLYDDLIQTLRDAGVKLCFWRAAECARARGRRSGENGQYELLDCKNHIKQLIVDCEVAIVSDRNVGSCYFRNPAYSSVEVCVAGACVAKLESQFADIWTQGGAMDPFLPSAEVVSEQSKLMNLLCDSAADNAERLFSDVWSASLASTPRELATGIDPILLAMILGVRSAKRSIDMMFAYMELCQPLRDELILAVKRGVKVRVVTNARETNDLFWINGACLQSALPVVEAGGKLVMSVCTPEAKGHVHAKIAVIDDQYLLCGSWNAWLRSTLYEIESSVLIDCAGLANRVARTIDTLEASQAYRVFDTSDIQKELDEDPLGTDPAVSIFL
eukprot:TRINITY_DN9215_c0_g2_i1.p1 TRINITY_DN9215_c0_g2~~TRINITY_DN9215_c0_g2_i1.p1  ORF type:complete len:578 (-),score=77.30 TRINITY_DN9215_c0_g2_i1:328-2061(-)